MKVFFNRSSAARLSGLAFLSVVVLALVGCEAEQKVEEEVLRPVRFITVEDGAARRTRAFSGTSKSTQESRLSFKVAGTIIELPIKVGDNLKAGTVIARLDPAQYELQAQQAQATLVQAQASARNAKANYERVKGLYENKNASRNDLDGARANAESTVAQQKAAQKSLELARLNVSYTKLRLESDCTVASVDLEVNENVTSGTQIAKVNCGDGLEVEISVPEGLIAKVDKGMDVLLGFDALPELNFSGKVTEVGVGVSDASATFPVIINVLERHPSLRSGLAVEASIAFPENGRQTAYFLPLSAVIRDPAGTYVFLAEGSVDKEEATVQRKPVAIGELTDAGIEILDGLARGDRVITAGVSVIREGQKVLAR